jgi:Tol biopolymer transport system component
MLNGQTLNKRYIVRRAIGEGGMGSVYEALDINLQTIVAIKYALPTQSPGSRQGKSAPFENEARLLASLRHPGLPKVIDYFTEELYGSFLVMEYIPGEDLYTMLKQRDGPFDLDTVLVWADQLLDILNYLHSQDIPIIHRDIKPNNLKLTSTNQIILLDFGIAKAGDQKSREAYTYEYTPVEQFKMLGTDARSDLYSLSVTLYHLLSGAEPAGSLTREAALLEKTPDPMPPLHTINPQIPEAISSVLHRGMAVQAVSRYASASEMRDRLREAAEEKSAPETIYADNGGHNSSSGAPAGSPWSGRFRIVVIIALLLVFGGGVWAERAGLFANSTAETTEPAITPIPTSTNTSANSAPVAQSDPTPIVTVSPPATSAASPSVPVAPTAAPTQTPTPIPSGPTGEIAYVSVADGAIWIVPADGSAAPARLFGPNALQVSTLSWSPDGARLAFAAEQAGNSDIYVINRDGSGLMNLTNDPGDDEDPAWSPDGNRIAFVADRNGNRDDLYVMNADGTDEQPLLVDQTSKSSPTWSPDGNRIAYEARIGGNREIFVMNTNGTNVRNLTNNPADDIEPVWSRHSNLIAFASDRGNVTDNIYTLDPDIPGSLRSLTNDPQLERSPSWSPDGAYIAFRASRGGKNGIYIVRVDDPTEPMSLTGVTPTDDHFPAWAPGP